MNSVEIRHLQYIIETDESDVNLKDGIKDSEGANINFTEVDNASVEYPEIKIKDDNIIDIEDIYICMTNEEAMTEEVRSNQRRMMIVLRFCLHSKCIRYDPNT